MLDEEGKLKKEWEIALAIIVLIVLLVITGVYAYASHRYGGFFSFFTSAYPQFIRGAESALGYAIGLSIVLSLMFMIGIIYTVENLKRMRNKEEEMHSAKVEPGFEENLKGDPNMTKRWNAILEKVESNNESDWRQAIIEADIMLEDLLVRLGYQGTGVGEKMDRVAKGDFKTLPAAKEAHYIRNRIAHDGSDHPFDQLEARRVIGLYRSVFEEFYYI